MNKKTTICFVAGRSGGHIIPALTLAKKEKKNNPNLSVLFFSANSDLDKQLTDNAKIINWNHHIPLENIQLRKPWKLPFFCFNFIYYLTKSFFLLLKKKPTTVISTGGYISIPVCFAAWFLKIPIELYELNAKPGKTTKFLAPLATKIHICFTETKKFLPKNKTIFSPYPIKYEINKLLSRKEKLKKTILVLGGSQGSIQLNDLIKNIVLNSKKFGENFNIIHQTGNIDKTNWKQFYKKNNITAIIEPFFNNLETYYKSSDLVICRSGAGSLFETLFFKKQCITIPLETKNNNHQLFNALSMEKEYPTLFTVVRHKETNKININLLNNVNSI